MGGTEEHLARIARQHLETARLLGVDFVPVAASDRAAPSPRGDHSGGDSSPRPSAPIIAEAKPAPRLSAPDSKEARLAELRKQYEREAEVPRQIKGWNKIVFGDGCPEARLMFVGEAPGADEDVQGIPFVGRAGQKLNEMITAMGLRREDVYIANVLKVRPPDNRTPTPEEAQLDGPYLVDQIRIIAPEVIVALGRPASHFLLNTTDSMSNMRGRWFAFEGIPVMPTFHPAYLLRAYTPENRQKVWSDLQQVMRKLGMPAG